jgi:hypothetical protein
VEPTFGSSDPLLADDRSSFHVALSQPGVLRALDAPGYAPSSPVPTGACGVRGVSDIPSLHRLLRRAWQLSRSLPDELLHAFEKKTAALPRSTEAERLVVQRVGQDLFRGGLLDYWDRRCAITGLAVPELLRASHIKSWADCETDAERLDVSNGFLLAPHLDAAFDAGFITVDGEGGVVTSGTLAAEDRALLGLDGPLRVRGLVEGHRRYLGWNRGRVFQTKGMIHRC